VGGGRPRDRRKKKKNRLHHRIDIPLSQVARGGKPGGQRGEAKKSCLYREESRPIYYTEKGKRKIFLGGDSGKGECRGGRDGQKLLSVSSDLRESAVQERKSKKKGNSVQEDRDLQKATGKAPPVCSKGAKTPS